MGTAKGVGTATTEMPGGASESSHEAVDSEIETNDALPKCSVKFGAGFTEPTEPYANVRVYVEIQIEGSVGEQDDIFDFAEEWVNDRLTTKMGEVKSMKGE
jgi:hypothetical protein